MKIFCDTNVLVAGVVSRHPHYEAARPVLERVVQKKDAGFVATHSLAETYAVLTRLPAPNRVPASIAWPLLENLVENFSVISLGQKDYLKALEEGSRNGVEGGRIYDMLLLAAAAKAGVDRIYTFNVSHFHELASEGLKKRIVAP